MAIYVQMKIYYYFHFDHFERKQLFIIFFKSQIKRIGRKNVKTEINYNYLDFF